MADDFARRWHQTHPRVSAAADHLVSERGLERHVADTRALEEEFWHIVETNVEEVKVEYGSDLDADVSAPVSLELSNPARMRTRTRTRREGTPHAWDFGEMITHPSNLLRTVGAKIPGLTPLAVLWHDVQRVLLARGGPFTSGGVNYLHAGARPRRGTGCPPRVPTRSSARSRLWCRV